MKRLILRFVAVLASAIAVAVAQTPGDTLVVTRDVMVPMRDGVRLATDILFPAKAGIALEGRRPVVLERTPYRKGANLYMTIPFLQNGYIVVLQDVRGRYASEGRWRPLRDDVTDGTDTTKWIAAQPWSDGNIGTMGSS